MTRTHRLFQLMQALRNAAPPATASGLAQTLGVTSRTIYRDIDALRGLGAVIDGAAGFGYTLIEDAALPPLSFGDEELEALVLGLREVGEVGDPALAKAAASALSKLRARLPASQAHRLEHAVLTARRFAPLSIVFMQASHCLLAWCHLRHDFRAFRLDRMRVLVVTEASFRPRRVAMLRDCLAQMSAGQAG